jgi:DNA modification methylase
MIGGQAVHEVDCFDGFSAMEDGTVDNVSTSPPYNLGGFHSNQKKREYAGYDDSMSEGSYRLFIKRFVSESFRVLKNTGSLFLNMKTRIVEGEAIPPYWIFDHVPFFLKQEIIWHYPSTANVDKVRFYPLFEYVFWFIKDVKNFKWNPEWSVIGNVWCINHMTDRKETRLGDVQHPAPFPTQLAQAMVLSTTSEGDTVLDPFAGSCTVLKVCRKYKRIGIGFEKYFSEYQELARRRILSNDFPPTLLENVSPKKAGQTLDSFT